MTDAERCLPELNRIVAEADPNAEGDVTAEDIYATLQDFNWDADASAEVNPGFDPDGTHVFKDGSVIHPIGGSDWGWTL